MAPGDRFLKHRYDYGKAKLSSGNAFNETTKHMQNEFVEYNQYYMGRPGRRQQVDKIIKYKYPTCVDTTYQREHAKYNTVKVVGNKQTAENFNVEKEHKILNPHDVQLKTTNGDVYQNPGMAPKPQQYPVAPPPRQPYPMKTSN